MTTAYTPRPGTACAEVLACLDGTPRALRSLGRRSMAERHTALMRLHRQGMIQRHPVNAKRSKWSLTAAGAAARERSQTALRRSDAQLLLCLSGEPQSAAEVTARANALGWPLFRTAVHVSLQELWMRDLVVRTNSSPTRWFLTEAGEDAQAAAPTRLSSPPQENA